jgi:polygalacturonase
LKNSANFHVTFTRGPGLTVWGVTIDTPRTARNCDGIDFISSSDVTIVHSAIRTGDDHAAIKAGDAGPASPMTIAHNRFFSGHGMSIGSETNGGVSAIRVTDLAIDGADNGLRIKSTAGRGGLVDDVVYDDVCIRQTKNPVILDMLYTMTAADRRVSPRQPELREIVLRRVRVLAPGAPILRGVDGHGVVLEDVQFNAPAESCASRFVQ